VYQIYTGISVLLCVFFYWYYIQDLQKYKGLRLSLWYMIINNIPIFISLIWLESGVYVVEQDAHSYLNGASVYFLLYNVVFYFGTKLGYLLTSGIARTVTTKRDITPNEKKYTLQLLLFSIISLFINYLLSPKPFFTDGITRFNYWENSAIPILSAIFGNVSAFIAIGLGCIFWIGKSQSALKLFIVYIIYLILIGHKFGAPLMGIVLFTLPRIVGEQSLISFVKKYLPKIIAVGSIIGIVVYYHYFVANPYSYADLGVGEALAQRAFVLQGHVFWGSVKYESILADKWEFDDLFNGMRTMMVLLSPASTYIIDESYFSGHSFTAAYPAILNVLTSIPVGLVLNGLVGIPHGVLIFLCAKNLFTGRVLLTMFSIQLLLWFEYMFTMAKFNYLINPFFWVVAIIVFIGSYIRFSWNHKREQ